MCVCVDCQLVYSLSLSGRHLGSEGREKRLAEEEGELLLFIMGCNIRAVANDKQDSGERETGGRI